MHLRLAVELTSFIGREREIATVRELLGTTRLLTLTGAGGSGKTRLAREVAAQLAREFPHGLAWVELAPLSSSELLPQQIASALGLREQAGLSATESLLQALHEQSLLLVLDNCEHLIEACAQLVDQLLRGCAGLTILATSREALGVAGERAWLVPALSLPEIGSTARHVVGRAEAAQLFLARARDSVPGFQLTEANAAAVARICRSLDGIPLAIELAAARVRVLTPEQIAERLGDAFRLLSGGRRTAVPRQQTLRATMDWSYALLAEREQKLLQRLSVFAGGFTIEAAETVCADEQIETIEVLDLLSALVDKSVVTMEACNGEARYQLLEVMRQYARERLRAAGEAEHYRRRHAAFFLELAEDYDPLQTAPPAWRQRCEAEQDNLRAALRGSLDDGDVETATRLAAALRAFWYFKGLISEGRQWLEGALAASGGCAPSARANALMSAGIFAYVQGQLPVAAAFLEESVAIYRVLDDPPWTARAVNRLGVARMEQGRFEEADLLFEEAWHLVRDTDDRYWKSAIQNVRGKVALKRGDLGRAASHLEEGLSLAQAIDADGMVAGILGNLARVARAVGDHAQEESILREALPRMRETGCYDTIETLATMAGIAAGRDDLERAARLFGAAEALFAGLGGHVTATERSTYERDLANARSRADEASWSRWWSEGEAMTLEGAVEYALGVEPTLPSSGDSPPAVGVAKPQPADPPPPAQPVASTPAAAPAERAEAADAMPPAPPALRVRALGPLQLYREGELLPADAWSYAKPRELLLYLLAHPQGRTREQIGLVFWPDASAAQVKNSFHVTLHHLRKTLGRSDWIVFHEERYHVNPELGCEFDAALFEEQLTAALREVRSGAGTLTPERLASVLGLYRGDFLEEEACGDWHLDMRDQLRRHWLEGMLALGELLVEAERWTEAAEVYERIVRKEDLHEEAHRRLMLCWARAGERSRALKHYERLTVLLCAELDADPEEETTALYERLKQVVPI